METCDRYGARVRFGVFSVFCHLQMSNVAEPSTKQQCEILPILLSGLNPHASDDFPESF